MARRKLLLNIEREIQELWDERKVFEVDADEAAKPKFFVTFPYAYMNGKMHLGHGFSCSKGEFQARFQRLLGKHVLWPFAFHGTGMPIAACADKLKKELRERAETTNVGPNKATATAEEETDIVGERRFRGAKTKLVAKTGGFASQWDIMIQLGVPENEIPQFTDAQHWLYYFPNLAKRDFQKLGMAMDWRRAFVTTDLNPYYDSFVQWQFRMLRKMDKIKFGMRPSVFSRLTNQPCLDHDRASGEGKNPQEYTLIKMKVRELPASWKVPEGKEVFMVAATLRPETMYGQTNCFVLPQGDYVLVPAFDRQQTLSKGASFLALPMTQEEAISTCSSIFLCSLRSAENMGYQGLIPVSPVDRTPHVLGSLRGEEVIGTPLSAPLATFETVYAVPMFGISMDKGTGVVTSVPSDAPDDFAALKDLQDKEALRDKFGITKSMVDMDVVEIIDIPGMGRRAAVELYHQKKISSQNDKEKLREAKEEVYKKGFCEGTLIVGPHAGLPVQEAKPLVKAELVAGGQAAIYYEPEARVVGRSGETCVVALCNQWYLDYGNPDWKAPVMSWVKGEMQPDGHPSPFHTYNPSCLSQFIHVVDWLQDWACSRQYGLGTALPWDKSLVIESLSDSTIYFAYYTIAHMLQKDIYGHVAGSAGIPAADLTDDVWDFIFARREEMPATRIPEDTLRSMRREFEFWYPVDLRVSGKDLIFNHLTMALFNHCAFWEKNPTTRWPQSYYCNGIVLLDHEKMSKSTGNFLTLEQAIEEYTADGTRIGFADAGDTLDDANFQRESASNAMMRLYHIVVFAEGLQDDAELRPEDAPRLTVDLMFENELVMLVEQTRDAYERMAFREGLKSAFFDFLNARDSYRMMAATSGCHKGSLLLWLEWLSLILSPITPHVCEHIYSRILKKPTLVVNARWPIPAKCFDPVMHLKTQYIVSTVEAFRKAREKFALGDGKKGKKSAILPADAPVEGTVYIAKSYLPWQMTVLDFLQKNIAVNDMGRAPKDPNFMDTVKGVVPLLNGDKKLAGKAMSFASFQIKEELKRRGPDAFSSTPTFDEEEVLEEFRPFFEKSLGVKRLAFASATDETQATNSTRAAVMKTAKPIAPAIYFNTS